MRWLRLIKHGVLQTTGRSNSQWLNHKEAALYIKKTPAALYKLTSNRIITYRKKGKSNMYKTTDLDLYLENGVIENVDTIAGGANLLPERKYRLNKKVKCPEVGKL